MQIKAHTGRPFLAINSITSIAGERMKSKSNERLEKRLTLSNQTSIAQFVNAMVSYKLGRSYFNSRSIIGMLTWGDIGRDNIDRIMGDNLMGIMMKLSGSRFQRKDMLKNGLIPWLLQHMQEEEYSASKYHLQCMVGLLRNLLRGSNLENFSSTETDKLIVLLGKGLSHDWNAPFNYLYSRSIFRARRRNSQAIRLRLTYSSVSKHKLCD